MAVASSARKRIQSIELCRLIASFFVVFIHYKMPGNLGLSVSALARFAVPFFFIISGYFSFNATPHQIRRRILGIVKLNFISTLLYLLWQSYKVRYIYFQSRLSWLKSVLTIRSISSWVFLNTNPFSGHLWYLNSVFICYCAIYIYIYWNSSKISYYPLYQAAFSLFAIHLIGGTFAASVQFAVPYLIYRNALFFGLPMFTLGLFLREYQDKIISIFHPSRTMLWIIILLGCMLTLLEYFGSGKVELHIGSLISVVALMLLLIIKPQVTPHHGILSKAITKCGTLSTWIYVTHIFWKDVYSTFGCEKHVYNILGEKMAAYLLPVIVIIISFSSGIVWEFLRSIMRQITGRIKD